MALDNTWYSEIHGAQGSAFSLKIKEKLHDEQTPFQRIEVYETEGFGTLMTIDGLVMLTDLDNFLYHEMMSHPALFTHPAPKRVLIIGGGDCGTLREVLRHPEVEGAWQVEIDERVTRAAEKYFPELCESNSDPRAHLHFEDGIKWVAEAADETYDVIIVDSTDPVGPAEGLFNEAFYHNVWRVLKPNGILVGQSESPLYHLDLIRSIHQALRRVGFADVVTMPFPQPVYPSGWWCATMASKDATVTNFREEAAANKPFKTRYYNAGIHRASLAAPELLREALAES